MDDTGKKVTAVFIRAEEVGPAGTLQALGGDLLDASGIGCDDIGKDDDEENQRHDAKADDSGFILFKAAPEL